MSHIPDQAQGDCQVTSLRLPNDENGASCGTMFDNNETVPVSKKINIKAIGGSSTRYQYREFGIFLITDHLEKSGFMKNKVLDVVRVSNVLTFISHFRCIQLYSC